MGLGPRGQTGQDIQERGYGWLNGRGQVTFRIPVRNVVVTSKHLDQLCNGRGICTRHAISSKLATAPALRKVGGVGQHAPEHHRYCVPPLHPSIYPNVQQQDLKLRWKHGRNGLVVHLASR